MIYECAGEVGGVSIENLILKCPERKSVKEGIYSSSIKADILYANNTEDMRAGL